MLPPRAASAACQSCGTPIYGTDGGVAIMDCPDCSGGGVVYVRDYDRAAGRIRAAEATLRLAERSGIPLLRAELDPLPDTETFQQLTVAQRARRMRERIVADNAQGWD